MRIIYEFDSQDDTFERKCFEKGPEFYQTLEEVSDFVRQMHDDIAKHGIQAVDIEDVLADLREIISMSTFNDV